MYSPPGEVDPIHSEDTGPIAFAMQYSTTNAMLGKNKTEVLDKLVSNHSISPDGKDWLVAALDPFHDYNHQIAGYPDADVSQTTVSCYQYELAVSKPAIAAGATWDCHIMTLPHMQSASCPVYNQSADWARMTDPATPLTWPIGPLSVIATSAGSPLTWPGVTGGTYSMNCLPATGVEDLTSGVSRVIGMGFEVHNTTAEIYKQGSVTTYRMPQSSEALNQSLFANNAGTSFGVVSGYRFALPPTTPAQANLLKGTRTWEAKDGVYATCFQSTVHNPLTKMANVHGLLDPTSDPGTNSLVVGTPLIAGLPATPSTYTPAATQFMPFDTTGAMFIGLSEQTSLMIKLKVYVERAPTWSEPQLAVLASPSAGYDIHALELYAAAINMLPAAVKVNENAAGDWWRGILSVIRHIAAPLGTALTPFVPGAGLVGSAVGNLLGQLNPSRSVSAQSASKVMEAKPAVQIRPPSKKNGQVTNNKSRKGPRPAKS